MSRVRRTQLRQNFNYADLPRQMTLNGKSSNVFGKFFLILILIPLVEFVLLNQLYQRTNFLTALFVVFATGIVGLNLARRQGMKAWAAIHREMATGRTPSQEIMNGVMILLAGTFLITPGLLTDCVGFALLIPKLRIQLGQRLSKWFKAKTVTTFQSSTWANGDSPFGQTPASDEQTSDIEQPSVRVVERDESSS